MRGLSYLQGLLQGIGVYMEDVDLIDLLDIAVMNALHDNDPDRFEIIEIEVELSWDRSNFSPNGLATWFLGEVRILDHYSGKSDYAIIHEELADLQRLAGWSDTTKPQSLLEVVIKQGHPGELARESAERFRQKQHAPSLRPGVASMEGSFEKLIKTGLPGLNDVDRKRILDSARDKMIVVPGTAEKNWTDVEEVIVAHEYQAAKNVFIPGPTLTEKVTMLKFVWEPTDVVDITDDEKEMILKDGAAAWRVEMINQWEEAMKNGGPDAKPEG